MLLNAGNSTLNISIGINIFATSQGNEATLFHIPTLPL